MRVAFVSGFDERLGLEYISALLKKNGHEVALFIDRQFCNDEYVHLPWINRMFYPQRRIIEAIRKYQPDIVGFSVITDFYEWATELAALIKNTIDAPVIFGGVHPTAVPERVIQSDSVDIVCVGEGEQAVLELVESMQRGEIDYSIKNLWFKKNGKIISNEVRPLLGNLDFLPFPDKDLYYLQNPQYANFYFIVASRGCAYACSYCCHSYGRRLYAGKGKYLRRRTVANVIEELNKAKEKYGIEFIKFFDESLGSNIDWLRELCKQYKKHINIPFLCYLHPNDVSEETVTLLKQAGCIEITMGVQTIYRGMIPKILNRDIPLERIKRAIELIRKQNIVLVTDNIYAIPGEEQGTFENFFRFYNSNRVDHVYFYWLKYFPKAGITDWARDNNILDENQYESILNGKRNGPFNLIKGNTPNDQKKLLPFFSLIRFFPKKFIDWILNKKIYRFFPTFYSSRNSAVFISLYRFFMKHNSEIVGFGARILIRLNKSIAWARRTNNFLFTRKKRRK